MKWTESKPMDFHCVWGTNRLRGNAWGGSSGGGFSSCFLRWALETVGHEAGHLHKWPDFQGISMPVAPVRFLRGSGHLAGDLEIHLRCFRDPSLKTFYL